MERLCIKIAGESGSGLLSVGEIIIKSLHNLGFYVVADREYPSVIKGDPACFLINASSKPICSLYSKADVMLAIDRLSLEAYCNDLNDGGILVYGYERALGLKDLTADLSKRGVKIVHQNARTIAEENGGNVLMSNMVLLGMFFKVLGLPYAAVEKEVEKKFANKPHLLKIDLKCMEAGYKKVEILERVELPKRDVRTVLLDGNKAIAIGAIRAGCRAYYAYPMSPASSILTYMADFSASTDVLVKQVEDEISVVNMALGSMFMGTRAFCATSGGGYDLMTETVSLSGMIECPLVVVVAQRPGPATGLPTWTAQADLNMAVYSSHGEFPRIVMAASDSSDCFSLIQHAFNFAEKYQIPVIVLTEKNICESILSINISGEKKIPIERGLVVGKDLANLKNSDRYKLTASGVSLRWLPGTSEAYYFANSDEHLEDGSLTENAENVKVMHEKRMKKADLIVEALPDPVIYGRKKGAKISFVGWGSSKKVMLDIIEDFAGRGISVNYLHYSYLCPLKISAAEKFFKENKNVFLIEGNFSGQLGNMLEEKAGVKFKGRFLKYDGRPFFTDEVAEFINKNI